LGSWPDRGADSRPTPRWGGELGFGNGNWRGTATVVSNAANGAKHTPPWVMQGLVGEFESWSRSRPAHEEKVKLSGFFSRACGRPGLGFCLSRHLRSFLGQAATGPAGQTEQGQQHGRHSAASLPHPLVSTLVDAASKDKVHRMGMGGCGRLRCGWRRVACEVALVQIVWVQSRDGMTGLEFAGPDRSQMGHGLGDPAAGASTCQRPKLEFHSALTGCPVLHLISSCGGSCVASHDRVQRLSRPHNPSSVQWATPKH